MSSVACKLQSERSVWVNFERDYARRIGLKVFVYNAETGTLRQDTASPVPLHITVGVDEDDQHRADALLKWMKSERSFDVRTAATPFRMKEIPGLVAKLIHDQRVVVWLMGPRIGA